MSRFLRIVLAALILAGAWPAVSGARTSGTPVKPAPQHASPDPQPSGSPQPPAAAASPTIPPRVLNALQGALRSGVPQAYASFMRGATRQSGLIDIIRKDDQAFFELSSDDLDKTFIVAPSLASGIGSGAFAGRIYSPMLIRFVRVGKRILWVEPNARFFAPSTAAQASLDVSVADSILASSPIIAEDVQKKRIVIAANLFLTDLEGVGTELERSTGPSPSIGNLFTVPARSGFSVDSQRSYVVDTKALPENDEILVNLTFAGAPGVTQAVPDARGIPIRVHYSIIEAPNDGYVPRLADDRIGYFVTARKRIADDSRPSPFVRYIDRRNLAGGPQVFYLTKEIPPEYRDAVRRGILAWNEAFAKIGYPHAIEVRDAPDDPSWDPDDVRYSVVRWISSDRPDFGGMSMSLVDPRTGEILRSEIVIEGEAVRSMRRGYVERVAPTAHGFSYRFAEQASLGTLMMRIATHPSPKQIDRYTQDFVTSLLVHETGHALGLEHNFTGHTAYTLAQLADPAFTKAHGISSSAMDYNAVNLAPPGKPQGAFFQLRPGTYDDWAIEYGYKRVLPDVKDPADELPALDTIASRSTRPELRFATDDDASGLGALDPRVAPFGLSSDPIGFAAQAMKIDAALTARLSRLTPHDSESYADERTAFLVVMDNACDSALAATRYIGGMYASRAHRGQPDAQPPFTMIPRALQRKAFDLVAAHIFAPNALVFSPQLLNDLGSERFSHWGSESPARPDFPITRFVDNVQTEILSQLFKPLTLQRLSDMEQKARPGETMSLADLFEWSRAAIWNDAADPADGRIGVAHRNLQQTFLQLMTALSLMPPGKMEQAGIPADAQALARHELEAIRTSAAAGLHRKNLDLLTRVHLEDALVHVRAALNAAIQRPA